MTLYGVALVCCVKLHVSSLRVQLLLPVVAAYSAPTTEPIPLSQETNLPEENAGGRKSCIAYRPGRELPRSNPTSGVPIRGPKRKTPAKAAGKRGFWSERSSSFGASAHALPPYAEVGTWPPGSCGRSGGRCSPWPRMPRPRAGKRGRWGWGTWGQWGTSYLEGQFGAGGRGNLSKLSAATTGRSRSHLTERETEVHSRASLLGRGTLEDPRSRPRRWELFWLNWGRACPAPFSSFGAYRWIGILS